MKFTQDSNNVKNKSWHHDSIATTLETLKTSEKGLTTDEVKERQKQYGLNEIPEGTTRPWWLILLTQFKSLLILILFIAAVISALSDHMIDAYVIMAVIMLNAIIGFVQEIKAEKAIASLRNMLVVEAKVLRDGKKTSVVSKELVPGDLIILEEGDSIPADGRIIYAKNLRTIEAPLTGESLPIEKKVGETKVETPVADRFNMVYKGTHVSGGFAHAVVTTTGLNTAYGEIAKSLQTIKKVKTNFQKKTDKLGRQMAMIAIASSATLFLIGYLFQDYELDELLIISLAALVSAIPERLPVVLAIVLAIGANRMSKRNVIIREFYGYRNIRCSNYYHYR